MPSESVVVKRVLSHKDRLSACQLIHVANITYDYVLWVITKWTSSRMQATVSLKEMSFLQRVAELSLCHSAKSSDIRVELKAELLLVCVERSQLRWLGNLNLARKPPIRFYGDGFWAFPGEKDRGPTGKTISIGWLLDPDEQQECGGIDRHAPLSSNCPLFLTKNVLEPDTIVQIQHGANIGICCKHIGQNTKPRPSPCGQPQLTVSLTALYL